MARHDNEPGAGQDRRDLMGGPDRPEYETEFGGPEPEGDKEAFGGPDRPEYETEFGGPEPEGQRDVMGGPDPDRREDEISPQDS